MTATYFRGKYNRSTGSKIAIPLSDRANSHSQSLSHMILIEATEFESIRYCKKAGKLEDLEKKKSELKVS